MNCFIAETAHIFRSRRYNDYDQDVHLPTRPVDKDKAEAELTLNIKKATSIEETAPKQKHVRSKERGLLAWFHRWALTILRIIDTECIVYTWDYHSSASIWTGLKVQPILADEVQTFKALISVHKILQEGHPIVCINPLYAQCGLQRLYCRLSRKHKAKSAGLRRVRGQSATMAQEVRL